jgi:hypothetical protein
MGRSRRGQGEENPRPAPINEQQCAAQQSASATWPSQSRESSAAPSCFVLLPTLPGRAFYEQAWLGNDKKYIAELDRLSDEGRDSLERVLTDAEQKLQTLQEQCAATLTTVKALQEQLTQERRRRERPPAPRH